jgi:hypothetical protein
VLVGVERGISMSTACSMECWDSGAVPFRAVRIEGESGTVPFRADRFEGSGTVPIRAVRSGWSRRCLAALVQNAVGMGSDI